MAATAACERCSTSAANNNISKKNTQKKLEYVTFISEKGSSASHIILRAGSAIVVPVWTDNCAACDQNRTRSRTCSSTYH